MACLGVALGLHCNLHSTLHLHDCPPHLHPRVSGAGSLFTIFASCTTLRTAKMRRQIGRHRVTSTVTFPTTIALTILFFPAGARADCWFDKYVLLSPISKENFLTFVVARACTYTWNYSVPRRLSFMAHSVWRKRYEPRMKYVLIR